MLTRFTDFGWGDLPRGLAELEDFRRRMNRLFEESDVGRPLLALERSASPAWPRACLYDTNDAYVLKAVVPGLSEKELEISLNRNVLSVSGERRLEVPEGYSVHRRERGAVKFARSFSLPGTVDPEHASARVKDGILTVTVAKAPEAKPRQIAVETR